MFTVDYKIKDTFFDRPKVVAMMQDQSVKMLGRAGFYVRRIARGSMKKKGRARTPPKNQKGKVYEKWLKEIKDRPASPPGKPPYAHTDHAVATLRNILYGYEANKNGIVVGPVALNQKQYFNGKFRSGTVPGLQEFGGTAGIREKLVGNSWRPVGRKKPRPGQATRVRIARYPARPYMAPTLAKVREKFPQLWYGSINAA